MKFQIILVLAFASAAFGQTRSELEAQLASAQATLSAKQSAKTSADAALVAANAAQIAAQTAATDAANQVTAAEAEVARIQALIDALPPDPGGTVPLSMATEPILTNDAYTHTIGSKWLGAEFTGSPEIGTTAINLRFRVDRQDTLDAPVVYSIDWTQPGGVKGLPANTIWNGHNIGDLYFAPALAHAGLHIIKVTGTVGTNVVSKTINLTLATNVSLPGATATNGEIRSFYWQMTYQAEPLKTDVAWPASNCIWFTEPDGSGRSNNPAADYNVQPIGQFGTPRTVSISPSKAGAFTTVGVYSRCTRTNTFSAWNSQSPSYSSSQTNAYGTVGFSRYVADVTHLIGAQESRYPTYDPFLAAWNGLWSRLSDSARRKIISRGQYVQVFQSALRQCLAGATGEYISESVRHPTVYNSQTFDQAKLAQFVAGLESGKSVPMLTLRVLSEDFTATEQVHTVERSIARTWVGLVRDRTIRLDARQAFVESGSLKQIVWSVLENGGDPANVTITPLNQRATIVDIKARCPNQMVKIGAFAEAADDGRDPLLKYSAPCFISLSNWSDVCESRGQDIDNSTVVDGNYIALYGSTYPSKVPSSNYPGYNPYDKRQYRIYDAAGKILRCSSGGRGELWRRMNTPSAIGDHKEDVFSYDASGVMTGFKRYYAFGGGVYATDHLPGGLKIIAKDQGGSVVQADWMVARYTAPPTGTIEQSAATYYWAGGQLVRIEHVTWKPDPAATTNRARDIRTVTGYETFSGSAFTLFGPTGVIQGTGTVGTAAVTSGSASAPYSGKIEDLAASLAKLRTLLGI